MVGAGCGSADRPTAEQNATVPTDIPTEESVVVDTADDSTRAPLPTISDATYDDHPLLADMLDAAEYFDDPALADLFVMIGASRYLLVDEEGRAIETTDETYRQRTVDFSAWHGSEQPIVYLMSTFGSYEDPQFGHQSDCSGASGVLDKEPGRNSYRFSADGFPTLFDNRYFPGDEGCAEEDLSVLPFLGGPFSIDVNDDKSLTITGDDETVTRLAWVDTAAGH